MPVLFVRVSSGVFALDSASILLKSGNLTSFSFVPKRGIFSGDTQICDTRLSVSRCGEGGGGMVLSLEEAECKMYRQSTCAK